MTAAQQKVLSALLVCRTQTEAAAKAGVTPRTVGRYLADPSFMAEYRKALSGLIDDAATDAKRALSPALSVLREIAEDEQQPAPTRVAASRALLEYGIRLTEQVDIVTRVDEIHKMMLDAENNY